MVYVLSISEILHVAPSRCLLYSVEKKLQAKKANKKR